MTLSTKIVAALLCGLTLLTSLPSSASPEPADRFLSRIPSTRLPSFQNIISENPETVVPDYVEVQWTGRGQDYALRRPAPPAAPRGGHGHGHWHHPHWPRPRIKKFVLFASCVIRSFYIVRFEANDNPDEPIGSGLGPDARCPKEPRVYLEQATRFSEHFFNL